MARIGLVIDDEYFDAGELDLMAIEDRGRGSRWVLADIRGAHRHKR